LWVKKCEHIYKELSFKRLQALQIKEIIGMWHIVKHALHICHKLAAKILLEITVRAAE